MGMYDDVEAPPIQCRKCNKILVCWQSKDGPCILGKLSYLEVNNFYTICDHCHAWNSYVRKSAKTLDDYELETDKE